MTTRKILIIQRYIEGKSFKFFTLKLYGSNTTHEVFSIQKVWVENDPRSISHKKVWVGLDPRSTMWGCCVEASEKISFSAKLR